MVHSQKNKERIEKFMQTGKTDFVYKNDIDKACFQLDMAYGKTKHLAKRTHSDKVLRDKAFRISSNLNYGEYQRGLASMVYNFLIKKFLVEQLNPNQLINSQMNFIKKKKEELIPFTHFRQFKQKTK